MSDKAQRTIRLKELGANVDKYTGPSPDYLTKTDGLAAGTFRLRTDANGFVISGDPPLEGGETWIFLGDSFVESAYVAEDARFPTLIERQLRAAGRPVTCLNGGYSGATTLHLFNILMNKILPLKPARVLFFAPTNDTRAFAHPGGYWCNYELFTPIMPPDSTRPAVSRVENAQALILELFVSACAMAGIGLVLATSPHRTQNEADDPWLAKRYNRKAFQATIDARRDCNAVVRELAGRHGIPLIDLEAMNADYASVSYDDVHLHEAGSAVIAAQIITALGNQA